MSRPHAKSRHERRKHNAPRCPKCNDQGARPVVVPGGPYQSKLAPCPYCQAGKAMKAHIAKLSPKEATTALVTGVPGEKR